MGNGSSITLINDTPYQFRIWFALLGGGMPYGGWYGRESLENYDKEIEFISPNQKLIKFFTLSLVMNVVISLGNSYNEELKITLFSPSRNDQNKDILVSQILKDRYCVVESLQVANKVYQKNFVYYSKSMDKIYEPIDEYYTKPFESYPIFLRLKGQSFAMIDNQFGYNKDKSNLLNIAIEESNFSDQQTTSNSFVQESDSNSENDVSYKSESESRKEENNG